MSFSRLRAIRKICRRRRRTAEGLVYVIAPWSSFFPHVALFRFCSLSLSVSLLFLVHGSLSLPFIPFFLSRSLSFWQSQSSIFRYVGFFSGRDNGTPHLTWGFEDWFLRCYPRKSSYCMNDSVEKNDAESVDRSVESDHLRLRFWSC